MDATISHLSRQQGRGAISPAAPLFLLPSIAWALLSHAPSWQLMWGLAVSIYAGLKWLSFASSPASRGAPVVRALAYLVLWPGMDAQAFLDADRRMVRPTTGEWLLAIARLAAGIILIWGVAPRFIPEHWLAAGWIGMVGLVLVLHFGLFHLVSLGWRSVGIDAVPIMNFPLRSSSLSDFWGKRWNLAFRDLSHRHIFRPLVGRCGAAGATMAVFLVSGLVHELVISLPVRGGWGGPTAYFVIQGCGLLLERSAMGQKLGLRKGLTGRVCCGLFLLLPLGWLFHEPFIVHAILPTLRALGAL